MIITPCQMKRGRSSSFGGRKGGYKRARNANGGTSVRLKHKEQILDVLVPANGGTFQIIKAFALNPGLADTFPWLSGIAKNYEEYDFHSLCFYFRSTTSDTSAVSPALGSIIMATQYNSLEDGFQDKREMENAPRVVSNKISMDLKHSPLVNKGVLKTQYIRTANVPLGDVRFDDVGKTYIASSGLPIGGTFVAGQQMGELWVKYDVTLKKPIWNSSSVMTDHWTLNNATTLAATPLSTAAVQVYAKMPGASITTGNTYNFPPSLKKGTYMFHYQVRGNAALWTPPPITSSNCFIRRAWETNLITGPVGTSLGVNNPSGSACFFMTLTGSNAWVNFGVGVIPTSVVAADLWVTQVDENIVFGN